MAPPELGKLTARPHPAIQRWGKTVQALSFAAEREFAGSPLLGPAVAPRLLRKRRLERETRDFRRAHRETAGRPECGSTRGGVRAPLCGAVNNGNTLCVPKCDYQRDGRGAHYRYD